MNIKNLKYFIATEILQQPIIRLKNLNRGGTSTNFLCQTKSNKYLIKVLPNKALSRINHLLNILKALKNVPEIYTAHVLEFNQKQYFEFENNVIIIINFIDGKTIKSKQITSQILDKIFASYQHIKEIKTEVLPQRNLHEIYLENNELIQSLKKTNKSWLKRKIINVINALNEQLNSDIKINAEPVIIHGDASLNNTMQDKEQNIALLDFELMRLGYEVEDWAEFLISSLSQHSVFSFPDKKFTELVTYTNKLFNFTKQDWQYGINLYFLNLIRKRIKSKKLFKSTRKATLFTLNIKKYKTISIVIDALY